MLILTANLNAKLADGRETTESRAASFFYDIGVN